MNAMSKGDLFPKIVEAYARPTRIISGKDVDNAIEVPHCNSVLMRKIIMLESIKFVLIYQPLCGFGVHS